MNLEESFISLTWLCPLQHPWLETFPSCLCLPYRRL